MTTPVPDDLRVALYDAENTWSADDDFYMRLVGDQPGTRVLDLGCGSGRLTLALAAAGCRVTGIDPDGPALAAARRKPDAEQVLWIEGTSRDVPPGARFDAVLMTAHVAQAIADDGVWAQTLVDVHEALTPGGLVAFDSRDPAARAWERWNPTDSRGTTALADGTRVEGWFDVTSIEGPASAEGSAEGSVVHLEDHSVLADGTHVVESGELAFRGEEGLRADLERAGFVVERVDGGWHGEPVGDGVGELVVVARPV